MSTQPSGKTVPAIGSRGWHVEGFSDGNFSIVIDAESPVQQALERMERRDQQVTASHHRTAPKRRARHDK